MYEPEATAAYILAKWKYDPETGIVLTTRGKATGVVVRGYVRLSARVKGKAVTVGAHCVAWLLMTGKWPTKHIDHRDLNPTNNRWTNLREATPAQNTQNRGQRKRKSTLPTGVYASCKKFEVIRTVDGVKYRAGRFDTVEEAEAASDALKAKLHTFHPGQPKQPGNSHPPPAKVGPKPLLPKPVATCETCGKVFEYARNTRLVPMSCSPTCRGIRAKKLGLLKPAAQARPKRVSAFDQSDRDKVRALLAAGNTVSAVAREFGVSRTHVRRLEKA